MGIKLIALDLDGTLLTSDKQLTPVVKAALESCIQKGIHVVLATGRMHAGIPAVLKNMPGIRYIIAANGAVIEDIKEKRVLARKSILWRDALQILDKFRHLPVMYDAQIAGIGKIEHRFLQNLETYVSDPAIRQMIRETREGISDLRSYIEEQQNDVDKFNITFRDEVARAQVRKELQRFKDIQITSSLSNNLELNCMEATKGNGLAFLTDYLQLNRPETMACGDAENDESMIKQAGIGVVMRNASLYMKGAADFVTDSNDDNGVAVAIERFVL